MSTLHRKIARVVLALYERGNRPDLLAVHDELARAGDQDPVDSAYIASLIDGVALKSDALCPIPRIGRREFYKRIPPQDVYDEHLPCRAVVLRKEHDRSQRGLLRFWIGRNRLEYLYHVAVGHRDTGFVDEKSGPKTLGKCGTVGPTLSLLMNPSTDGLALENSSSRSV